MVLTALAEGLDPSAAERVFGYRQATITTWLTRAGQHAQALHTRYFCNLQLPHVQLDEIRTRLRSAKQILWLWLAIDLLTKILPVLELGPARNTWRMSSSTRSDRAWLLAACRSSPVMASICISMPSRPTLVSGLRWVDEGATCAGGRWKQA